MEAGKPRRDTAPDSWLHLDLASGSLDLVLPQVLLVIRPMLFPKGFGLTCYLCSWRLTLLLVEASPSGSGPMRPIFPKMEGFRSMVPEVPTAAMAIPCPSLPTESVMAQKENAELHGWVFTPAAWKVQAREEFRPLSLPRARKARGRSFIRDMLDFPTLLAFLFFIISFKISTSRGHLASSVRGAGCS